MMNKKFSDLFLRKDKNKQQPKAAALFDESYFHCRILSKGINTDLLNIQTQVKETGQPLDEIKCKWYIKNSKDFKEIEDVTSSYYQPCLDDVGSIICVQIEPFIEGKTYNGITIMEETEIIQLDNQLEQKLDEFLEAKYLKIDARIEAVYSQNTKYEDFELPLEVKAEIRQDSIVFVAGEQVIETVRISQEFPNIQFLRKTFSSILFNFNEKESMKLSLNNNTSRDLFALIVRTCAAHSCSEPISMNPQIAGLGDPSHAVTEQIVKTEQSNLQYVDVSNPKEEVVVEVESQEPSRKDSHQSSHKSRSNHTSPVVSSTQSFEEASRDHKESEIHKKAEQSKKSSTLFVLKLDQLNKELKILKRNHETLQRDYKLQKQGKNQAQNELQCLKKVLEPIRKERDEAITIARKVRQLKEDNRFYKNEIVIIKKELKDEKEKNRILEKKLMARDAEVIEEVEEKIFRFKRDYEEMKYEKQNIYKQTEHYEIQIEKFREQLEKNENQNVNLKKRLESLANEKGISKASKIIEISTQKKQSEGKVRQLQMKLKNVEMLLKYKSSHGDSTSNFHLLVNNLTQTVSQKQIQINDLKNINKNLLYQLKEVMATEKQ